MTKYKILPDSLAEAEAFTEASREELRVLLALISSDGAFESREALATLAKTSSARCASALVLWSEAGIIKEITDDSPTITEEFEERLRRGEIREESSVTVAKAIRNNNLRDMIDECTALMNRSALSTAEIKELAALHEQYGLSEEYIVTLGAFLAEKGTLTVKKLVNRAVSLSEKEIDTPQALAEYIRHLESISVAEIEFRKIFGTYTRALSKSEKEAFRKWSQDYGYFTEIVTEAFDIATANADTKHHVAYADKIITRWYETGCRTVSECRARYEADQAEYRAEKNAKREKARASKKAAEEKERYGGFDVNDAFMKALERSYGKDENNEENDRKED